MNEQQALHTELYGNVDTSQLKLRPVSHEHLNWVFDLETLGTDSNCIVTEVSAVAFDIVSGEVFHKLTYHLDIDEQVQLGRGISASTLGFWLFQDEAARSKLRLSDRQYCQDNAHKAPRNICGFATELKYAVEQASREWAEERGLNPQPLVWGNGITFDLGKLHSLFKSVDLEVPWAYWAERDARTLMDLMPDVKSAFGADFQGIPHFGLDDCLHELRYLSAGYIMLWELSKEK